jgi:hypothetical protein
MPDKKITALTETTSVAAADVIPVVTDTTGTPTTKKVTAANLKTYTNTGLVTSASPTFSGVVTMAVGSSIQGASGARIEIHGLRLAAPHTIEFEGTTEDAFETVLTAGDPTADRTITLPDATGTVALVGQQAYWG